MTLAAILDLNTLALVDADTSYLRSYPAIVRYFEERPQLTVDDFICGAHIAYGWMPTILEFAGDPVIATTIVNNARRDGSIDDEMLEKLSSIVNNSLVGASKILHFASPGAFPIWDSNIYGLVFGNEPYHYRMRDVQLYRGYNQRIAPLLESERFSKFHKAMNLKLGYDVTAIRAMELAIFLRARVSK